MCGIFERSRLRMKSPGSQGSDGGARLPFSSQHVHSPTPGRPSFRLEASLFAPCNQFFVYSIYCLDHAFEQCCMISMLMLSCRNSYVTPHAFHS